jgi:hypothetical protein
MKVLCPYVDLQYATEVTLRTEEANTEFVYTGHNETAYYEMAKKAWSEKETFIIVEHDVVIWPGALRALWDCEKSLCVYYAPGPVGVVGLGCVKYGSELMLRLPDHLNNVLAENKSWRVLDREMTYRLFDHGISFHTHEPMISHINPGRYNFENMISCK